MLNMDDLLHSVSDTLSADGAIATAPAPHASTLTYRVTPYEDTAYTPVAAWAMLSSLAEDNHPYAWTLSHVDGRTIILLTVRTTMASSGRRRMRASVNSTRRQPSSSTLTPPMR